MSENGNSTEIVLAAKTELATAETETIQTNGSSYKADFIQIAQKRLIDRQTKCAESNRENGSTLEFKDMSLRSFLVKADLDQLPLFTAELEVALLAGIYSRHIQSAVWDAKPGKYKRSPLGREEKRILQAKAGFAEDFQKVLIEKTDEKKSKVAARVADRVAEDRFHQRPLRDNWYRKISRLIGLPILNQSDLLEEVCPHADLQEYINVNSLIWNLARIGKLRANASGEKMRQMGLLNLETAKVMQEQYRDLPICIETRLALGHIESKLGITETLSVLPEIMFDQKNDSLMEMFDEAWDAAEDVNDDGGKDFDKKLSSNANS